VRLASVTRFSIALTLLAAAALAASGLSGLSGGGASVASARPSLPNGPAGSPGRGPYIFGRSVQGRPLVFSKIGDRDARRRALIVGQIHGDEPQGRRVVDRLRRKYRHVHGVAIWLVESVNPDGNAHDQRRNAHGVDLNRNFGVHWRSGEPPSSGYYPGPHAFSEPETRAVAKLVKQIKPDVSIWLHQPWGQVLAPSHGPAKPEKLYSRISGIPIERARGEELPGTAIRWSNKKLGGHAFVVELGPDDLSRRQLRRNTKAAITVAAGHSVRSSR
jgi:protein MpaA